ncbi:MAG: hypothetical protein WEE53_07245 [Acidimicrobiia bacterium]
MEMQIDHRPGTEVQANRNRWRGPLIGIAAAAAILVAGLVFVLTRDNTPVAEPAPNATRLTMSMEFQPIDPGAYFADTDLLESTSLRGTFVIESNGWLGTAAGAMKSLVDDGPYIALFIAEVDRVWSSACESGRTQQAAATTAEGLANQFVAAGFTNTGALTPVSAFGHEGYHLATEVRPSCISQDFTVWGGSNWDGRYYQTENQPLELWFLDVEGTPVLVEATWWPETPEEDVAELRTVLDTLVITP